MLTTDVVTELIEMTNHHVGTAAVVLAKRMLADASRASGRAVHHHQEKSVAKTAHALESADASAIAHHHHHADVIAHDPEAQTTLTGTYLAVVVRARARAAAMLENVMIAETASATIVGLVNVRIVATAQGVIGPEIMIAGTVAGSALVGVKNQTAINLAVAVLPLAMTKIGIETGSRGRGVGAGVGTEVETIGIAEDVQGQGAGAAVGADGVERYDSLREMYYHEITRSKVDGLRDVYTRAVTRGYGWMIVLGSTTSTFSENHHLVLQTRRQD